MMSVRIAYNGTAWRCVIPKLRNVIRLPIPPIAPIGTKYITKCSLFILLSGVIGQPGLKQSSEQKVEYMFAALSYSQTGCW